MVYGLKLGNPVETEAVVNYENIEYRKDVEFIEILGNLGVNLYVDKVVEEDDTPLTCITYKMKEKTVVFGLGEANRGINKRGYKYVSDNTDIPDQTEDIKSLYGAHNFLVFRDDEDEFGLFIDYPAYMEYDIGFSELNTTVIKIPSYDMYIYLITGCDLKSITGQFRHIIGKSYIPPLWAFGFGQSRYGYKSADEIRDVVNSYRAAQIPLDMVYLDIDYMQDYKNFTINEERFPDFENFVDEMKVQGVRLIPIIDAAVKNEEGYDVYDEGKAKGYFCTNDDNSLFSIGVWPGWTNLPDFLRPEVRTWWGSLYKRFTDIGIEGFWNDMNEPAMFYSGWSFGETIDKLNDIVSEEFEPKPQDLFDLNASINAWRSHEQFKRFYHIVDGKRIRHDRVHNLYGYNMTRGTAEGVEEALEGKRGLIFSRSSYIGMHRYAGIWTGDNCSWWSHLLLNLQMLPGLNMCGFLYSGADTGGFGCDVTEDLLLRWTALSIFTPLFRNHTSFGTRNQECYRFTKTEAFKEIISLRYRLIPYLYSEFLKCADRDEMYFRPLGFDFEYDDIALNVEDQLLLGEGLMIAPVYRQNAKGRYVYLPEDMLFIRFSSATQYSTELLKKGHHYIEADISQVPLFLRPGHILPLGNIEVCTDDMRKYIDAGSRGELESDDFEIINFSSESGYAGDLYELATEYERKLVINRLFVELQDKETAKDDDI